MINATLYDLEHERWLRARNAGEIVWTTKDGRDVPIKDMTDAHLENAINMIERNEMMNDVALTIGASSDWL